MKIIKRKKENTIGNVYYDVTDGTVKQITRRDGVWGHEVIDINNYKPEEVSVNEGDKYDTDNPSYKYPKKEFNPKPVDPFDPNAA